MIKKVLDREEILYYRPNSREDCDEDSPYIKKKHFLNIIFRIILMYFISNLMYFLFARKQNSCHKFLKICDQKKEIYSDS